MHFAKFAIFRFQDVTLIKFVALRHFIMGVNGKISKKLKILKMADRRAKWMKICDSWSSRTAYVLGGCFTCQILFNSVWGHSVHFTKFLMVRFSKGYSSPSFHSISFKPFYGKYMYGNIGVARRVYVFWLSAKFKQFTAVWRQVISATLPLTINLSWFHLAKGQAEHQGPWA